MQRVIERVINLLAFLLTAERPVTSDEIRNTVHGYDQGTDEAFRRTFERDKDLLRSLGVPLRLEHTDAWEVEQGYVVAPDEYALPDPGLTDEERVALLLATRMVRLGDGPPTPTAIMKLGGAPAIVGTDAITADLGETGTLGELFEAVVERRVAEFTYRDYGRRARPLGLVHRIGHWYLIAEQGKGDRRVFRVDRITDLTVGDEPGAFTRPPGFKASEAVPGAPWEAGEDDLDVTIAFDASVAWWARRQLSRNAEIEERDDGSISARFSAASLPPLISWLIGFEDAAEIIDPPEARQAMVSHLQASS